MEDPNQVALQQQQFRIEFLSALREEVVADYYRRIGFVVHSTSDDETRALFGMTRSEPAADIVVEGPRRNAIIAEVKGTDLDRALEQLMRTGYRAHQQRPQRFRSVQYKIFTGHLRRDGRDGTTCEARIPPATEYDLNGGFRVVSIFPREFPSGWLLQDQDGRDYRIDGRIPARGTHVVGGQNVYVIFGPPVPLRWEV